MTEKRKSKRRFTIAFYNLENFFDTKDDPDTLDDDFTPTGSRGWSKKKLTKKTNKLAKAIRHIGDDETQKHPILIGIAEVENSAVIELLFQTEQLEAINYGYVHFESPDERGIDTALIYDKDHFTVLGSQTIPLLIDNGNGGRDMTRDILYVQGKLNKEEVHVFVNHWPSRRDGEDETRYKRVKAAEVVLANIAAIQRPNSNVIVMGDFNDDPSSESIQKLTASGFLFNPMQRLLTPDQGSANYKGKWGLFDQILISHTFLNYEKGTHSFKKAGIFSPRFLKEWKGRYKGNPFRTFVGKKYLGGYSDHFPVYIIVKQHK
ncbi:MAG: endonuclease/exonuclease/phosphatase family protein [Bacteroidota bacterium]